VIALLLALALATEASTPTGGDSLFTAARTARTKSAYPHYATYVTVVRYRAGSQPVIRSWDTVEDIRQRLVHSQSISREESAHPTYPHGINIGVGGGAAGVPAAPVFGMPKPGGLVLNPAEADDAIGQLSLAVDQDFGLAIDARAIAATTSAEDVVSSKTVLPLIGRTGALARIYDVTVLGDVDDGGVTLHHMRLRPLRDPQRNRLRELWIDAATSLPVHAIVDGVGNHAPLDSVLWRVDFRRVVDGIYIARETALQPLDVDDGQLNDVSISFEELAPTNVLAPYVQLGLTDSVGTTDP
jgi:hypothetical protein